MSQKVILIRKEQNSDPKKWVGLGSVNYDPNNPELFLLPKDKSDNGWLEFMKESSLLEILHAMNYLLLTDSWTRQLKTK